VNVKRYCVGIGFTAASYPTLIPTGATTYIGTLAARTAMHAGTWDGDTLYFIGTFGAADRGQFPSNTAAGTTLSTNPLAAGGVTFGTTAYATSKACGVTFDFTNVTSWDMRGGSAPLNRCYAAFTAVGERIKVLLGVNTRIICPDFNYIAAAVAPGALTYADTFSFENNGIVLIGNGNSVIGPSAPLSDGYQIDGMKMWALNGIGMYVVGHASATKHLTNIIDGVNVQGCSTNIDVNYSALNSSILFFDVSVMVKGCRHGIPSWGGPGVNQCVNHSGDVSVEGNYKGKVYYIGNSHEHGSPVQDTAQIITSGAFIAFNSIKNSSCAAMVSGGVTYWRNMGIGLPWALAVDTTTTSNAFKLGLGDYDSATGSGGATVPTSWLGNDGTLGTASFAIELNNIVFANTIDGAYIGITFNGCTGMAILCNRIRNCWYAGCLTAVNANAFIAGNYLHCMASSLSFSGALQCTTSVRMYSYNNVCDNDNTGGNCWDMTITPDEAVGSENAGNVFGTGRVLVLGIDRYTEANDPNGTTATDLSAYDWDTGFPVGHWLRGAGSRAYLTTLRTACGDLDFYQLPLALTITPGPFSTP
jgi:hypothetical protein